ncbi:LacI family transcriptional regulator [Clostridium estertheticum]|uniref:LacI family DNA-binding transcriptional regulator n=1 Tax=Clostridium estertheticum TaxID=238834 RepID=UPI0013E91609|nr:LacI family DNA-binding transcriptional regulator [Clostridium estertheticum]MBZ9685977.1 LacI family transcriptional regulator [Clostridium estertheticum]
MNKQYTMEDVAKISGVSLSTVSRVLTNSAKVSKTKKSLVLKAVKELDYNINSLASNLASNKSKEIAVIIPDITNPFFAEVFKGIDDIISADNNHYSIMLCNTNFSRSKEKKYIEHIIKKRVEGVIVVSTDLSEELVNNIKRKTSIISIETFLKGVDMVDITNELAMFEATEYLISNGHKKIAFFGWQSGVHSLNQRMEGYKNALEKHNIPLKDNYLVNCGFTQAEVYIAAVNFMESKDIPTAIIAINDNTAISIMVAFEKIGVKIPEDISLIGFDNIVISRIVSPKLTTVAQPSYYMGETAAELLINKINKNRNQRDKETEEIPKRIILPTKLIIRGSVKKIF